MSAIQRKTTEITVLVDGVERRFRLRAHSIAKQLEQLERQEIGRNLGLELAGEALGTITPLTGGARAYLSSICPIVVDLLNEPADDGAPLTNDEFWLLDSDDPDRVIADQEKLTAMEKVLGNGLSLLGIAGRRILDQSKLDGLKSVPLSLEPA